MGAGFFLLALILHQRFPAWGPAAHSRSPKKSVVELVEMSKPIETNRNQSKIGT
jgi:hypothetical protein